MHNQFITSVKSHYKHISDIKDALEIAKEYNCYDLDELYFFCLGSGDGIKITELLLDHGVKYSPEKHSKSLFNLIFSSETLVNDVEFCLLLLKRPDLIPLSSHDFLLAMLKALYTNNIELLEALVERGIDINHTRNGDPYLKIAASISSRHILSYLVRLPNIDVNATDINGRNACFFASKIDKFHDLVMHGCNPNLVSYDGETPLSYLCKQSEKTGFIKYLLQRGDIEIPDHVLNKCHVENIEPILSEAIKRNICIFGGDPGVYGKFALLNAISAENKSAIILLLNQGVDPCATVSGTTALHKAATKKTILKLLIDCVNNICSADADNSRKIDYFVQNDLMETPLSMLVREGKQESFENIVLLAKAAPSTVFIENLDGSTMLHSAAADKITEFFIECGLRFCFPGMRKKSLGPCLQCRVFYCANCSNNISAKYCDKCDNYMCSNCVNTTTRNLHFPYRSDGNIHCIYCAKEEKNIKYNYTVLRNHQRFNIFTDFTIKTFQ